MSTIVYHDDTKLEVKKFVNSPSHALLIIGTADSGSPELARKIVSDLLKEDIDKVDTLPFTRLVSSNGDSSIGISEIRSLETFLSLKIPGSKKINRVIIIDDGHLMTHEAQNALLKILEEPPEGSLIILTSNQPELLLPTIRSRAQAIRVRRPSADSLTEHFAASGYDANSIQRAYNIADGQYNLMRQMFEDDSHPIFAYVAQAKEILSQSTYERWCSIELFYKSREDAMQLVEMLGQLAHTALLTSSKASVSRWKTVLIESETASEALRRNVQPKLVMTNLFLNLST